MYRCISILGSTGSIGTQTLDVCEQFNIKVYGLAANSSIDKLFEQIVKFNVKVASVATEELANKLQKMIDDVGIDTRIYYGDEGAKYVVSGDEVECVVSAIVGIAGLKPTLQAIYNNKDIALANKETLVTAGKFVTDEIAKRHLKLLPVDSEHSAIFQCLMGNDSNQVNKIILTASGGPFFRYSENELEKVTLEQALKHPNWDMGGKITIDSATMMNKGLEVIEAKWLFGVDSEKIDVVIHPQSIIHSMVEYDDSSIMAQLGLPDMRLPIQLALTYPKRYDGKLKHLDLCDIVTLEFYKPDLNKFRCLALAYDALATSDAMCNVLNAANEIAVWLFMNKKISFLDIGTVNENAMKQFKNETQKTIDDVFEIDKIVRDWVICKYN